MAVTGCVNDRTRSRFGGRSSFTLWGNTENEDAEDGGIVLECEEDDEVPPARWELKNRECKWRKGLRSNRQIYKINGAEGGCSVRQQRREKLKLKGRMVGAIGIYASSRCGVGAGPFGGDVMAYQAIPDWWRGSFEGVDRCPEGKRILVIN